MITKFKLFENITHNSRPQVGDYVLINCNQNNYLPTYNAFKKFIDNNIGQVISTSSTVIIVKYENIPDDIKDYFTKSDKESYRRFSLHEVIESSNNKNELEKYFTAKKYNL